MHHLMHLIGWAVDHGALLLLVFGGAAVAIARAECRELTRDRDEDRPW